MKQNMAPELMAGRNSDEVANVVEGGDDNDEDADIAALKDNIENVETLSPDAIEAKDGDAH